ncbi:ATP synthase mitochondrial F1 complex assembly factor 2 [Psilocybe cubensis]|uniref:ATP synthase mitochondrial F1 complex assembly factor 2 n=1 Tax=Psilocybe cubensis TaxID=181762 RepID=A0ACB8H7Z4_PSICU|nr:ATP synthase mitochondrial F1 complex assembly factor 2 [Psilocybe cubensis]KAH9483991.1 ATP synthase mitochondrial F1 complex assembly factor 2 [Psilocybe cubensis]
MLTHRLGRNTYLTCRSLPATRFGQKCNNLRWQSTDTHDGLPVTDTNRAELSQKRFWKDVGVERRGESLVVTLDKRALKTPGGQTLQLPLNKTLPAALAAAEWDHQEVLLKPHALPMTSIISRAVDAMVEEKTRAEVRAALVKYIHTDTICFFHDNPEPLERLQSQHWTPLLEWARKTFDVKLDVSNSIMSVRQSKETEEKMLKVMESFDQWEMAAMERATYAAKSLIIALALVKNRISVEEAALAATVEVNSQIERWGEVEDSFGFYLQKLPLHYAIGALQYHQPVEAR